MHPSDSEPEGRDITAKPSFAARAVATGLFAGYVPWASGTVGSLVGLIVYWIPGVHNGPWLPVLVALGLAAGAPSADIVARATGHRLTKIAARSKEAFQAGASHGPDPSIVVIDEIVGMWISLLFLPASLPLSIAAFIAFRVFDVLKPEPARWLERIPGGWGIMLDDVAAGIYANLACRLMIVAASALSLPLP
ncbi:MAG: phosphatidylglycerophosphatase [Bacteroidetes bacterium]|nr:phosphatidylglycerophosphatase [Bacteroidota bacterium]